MKRPIQTIVYGRSINRIAHSVLLKRQWHLRMRRERKPARYGLLHVTACVLLAAVTIQTPGVYARVIVTKGPTPITRGDAIGANDITVSNELFAVSFSVETAPPWGVARGGILDIALVNSGKPGLDIAALADFMPNRWSSWPTTYQRVTVDQTTAGQVTVNTERDWGNVELSTSFTIKDNDRTIHIVTTMTNAGDTALSDLMSGYVVWPDGGNLFGVPGLAGEYSGNENIANARWSAAYGEDWVLGLHAPFSTLVDYGGRDRYRRHSLQPGESNSFEAWLQIEHGDSLAPLVRNEIAFQQAPSGTVSGALSDTQGNSPVKAAVVVSKNGKPYAWVIGKDGQYSLSLPVGNYQLYATAPGHARGATRDVQVTSTTDIQLDFNDVQLPGTLQVEVIDAASKQPVDARISIQEGYRQLIRHFGDNTFFTELDAPGKINVSVPPGNYTLEVSAGAGFTSLAEIREVTVNPGQSQSLSVAIETLLEPASQSWYSADLHHHSDVLDGFTEAHFVLRSQRAANLDVAFLSDHDSVQNNALMQQLAQQQGMPFIAGTELSPSWAHFNAFPLDDGKTVDIDTGQATVQEVFAEARRMGADLIEANHPYNRYGYFESLEQTAVVDGVTTNAVPGGFDHRFDLAEIVTQDLEANTKTIKRVWQLWNEGHRIYFAAGSDVHDVWLSESGSARTYIHVENELNGDSVVASLKQGRAYATSGPLIVPAQMFGDTMTAESGAPLGLDYTVSAVAGLKQVQLVERGLVLDTHVFDSGEIEAPVSFTVRPSSSTWYSLVVEDLNQNMAYSNPHWIAVASASDSARNQPAIRAIVVSVLLIGILAVVRRVRVRH